MIPPPCLNLLHVLLTMEIAGVLTPPLLLTRPLAGRLAFRLQTEPLMPRITAARPKPSPAVTTPSQPFCAHRILPVLTGKNTTTDGAPRTMQNVVAAAMATTCPCRCEKKMIRSDQEEEEKKRDLSDRPKKSQFKAASRVLVVLRRVGIRPALCG